MGSRQALARAGSGAPPAGPLPTPAPLPPAWQVVRIKGRHDGRLEEYRSTAAYVAGRRVWELDALVDIAFPCATQACCTQSC